MRKRTRLNTDKFWTFDIETTTLITGIDSNGNLERNAIIWSGQFFDGTYYYQERSIEGVLKRLQYIADENENHLLKTVIFVHNLSYEFQFIKDFFEWKKILCTSKRKIISAETDKLVFRCSYMLSNMNLRNFLKTEGVPEAYQKSNMNYEVERFPWTPLTEEEKKYCKNDVVGLHIAMERRIADCSNGNINNLPLTSTGYVRKDCRKACQGNVNNRYRFWNEQMDIDTYNMCHKAFRGGNTHANRHYSGKVIPEEYSVDITSSYPFELLTKKYPGKFYDMKIFNRREFNYYLSKPQKWAMLIEVTFKRIELKNDNIPIPYISVSKCDSIHYFSGDDKKTRGVDNGRLIEADYCSMTITEIDYKIISSQYVWQDEKITRVKYAQKKPIMKELAYQIIHYYQMKTQLKGLDDPESVYMYGKAKNKLNGIYGMHVTDPIKFDYYMGKDHILYKVETEQDDQGVIHKVTPEYLLEKFYKSFSNFLSYQTGVWVTAYARQSLQEMIDVFYDPVTGVSDLIYVDTDSCKYRHKEKYLDKIEAINKRKIEEATEHFAYAKMGDKTFYLGVFTDEGMSPKFKTFGAKKYLYGDDRSLTKKKCQEILNKWEEDEKNNKMPDINDCPVTITISGVSKLEGMKCLLRDIIDDKIKSPFELDIGYSFHGIKLISQYNDYTEMHELNIDNHIVKYGSNIAMYPGSYTLGLSNEYEILLNQYKKEKWI